MEEKQCKSCKTVKDLSEFYSQKNKSDGLMGKCKECCKRDNKKNREEKIDYYRNYDKERGSSPSRVLSRKEYSDKMKRENPEKWKKMRKESTRKYRKKNPEKQRATRILNYHIQVGNMVKEFCEICGNPKSEAHHDDYSKPLEVRWLCDFHHKELHKKEREADV